MFRKFVLFLAVALVVGAGASCNHTKIACPTYADSFPETKKKGKPGSQKPEMPQASRAKASILPPNYQKKLDKAHKGQKRSAPALAPATPPANSGG